MKGVIAYIFSFMEISQYLLLLPTDWEEEHDGIGPNLQVGT